MASDIFNKLLNSEIQKFKTHFSNTAKELFYSEENGRLIHSGEFGIYREKIVITFLKMVMPQRLSINSGFIITPKNNVSTQCDIVIYDRNSTPLIKDDEQQTFYPIETVAGIGEIKSCLNKNELKKAINKLARNKKLRNDIITFSKKVENDGSRKMLDLTTEFTHHIFSFIICQKLDFNLENIDFDDLYDNDIEHIYRHNLILSVEDGLFAYNAIFDEKNHIYPYPFKYPQNLKSNFIKPTNKNPNYHFFAFSHLFFLGIDYSITFYPDIINYIK